MSSLDIPTFPVNSEDAELIIIFERCNGGTSDALTLGRICESDPTPAGIIRGGFDISNGLCCEGMGVNVGNELDPGRETEEWCRRPWCCV